MPTRADAIADLKRACGATVLGQSVTIESVPLAAVKRTLSQEDAAYFAAPGLRVEGIRLTFAPEDFPHPFVVGMACTVDGIEYEVQRVENPAERRRITFIRYLS